MNSAGETTSSERIINPVAKLEQPSLSNKCRKGVSGRTGAATGILIKLID
jgi:hypothetical protein